MTDHNAAQRTGLAHRKTSRARMSAASSAAPSGSAAARPRAEHGIAHVKTGVHKLKQTFGIHATTSTEADGTPPQHHHEGVCGTEPLFWHLGPPMMRRPQGLSLNLVRKFAVQILMCLYALSQSQVDGTQSAHSRPAAALRFDRNRRAG